VEEQPGVRTARPREVRVEAPDETRWNVDGELLEGGAKTLTVEGGAFDLVVR
jgi:hypothetical protein